MIAWGSEGRPDSARPLGWQVWRGQDNPGPDGGPALRAPCGRVRILPLALGGVCVAAGLQERAGVWVSANMRAAGGRSPAHRAATGARSARGLSLIQQVTRANADSIASGLNPALRLG